MLEAKVLQISDKGATTVTECQGVTPEAMPETDQPSELV